MFQKELSRPENQKKNYTFPYKEAKFSKLKHFLLIMIKCFFSFYNFFFYTQRVLVFHLLRGFCNVLCVKSVRIRSYFGPDFPAFGLNTERYPVSFRIQSEYGNIRNRITPNTDTFYAVVHDHIVAFFFYLLISFTSFVYSLFYFLAIILLINFEIFLYIWKKFMKKNYQNIYKKGIYYKI